MNLGGFRHNFISVNVSVNWICFYYALCVYELPAAALSAASGVCCAATLFSPW